ncbi:MAG TPA: DUF445 family protein [Pyrinomonadaceae bacterium]|nr:DUF445 family protein [Pyrinomonadaceae bacterium]
MLIDMLIFGLFAGLHGYLAAWLAVRMLFRPRHPVKIFGLTIWPQGMIPRHRQRLAEAIGRAVGTELVSQDTVIDALFETDFFRRKVESFVSTYTNELLGTNYPSLLEALPSAVRVPVIESVSALQFRLGEYIEQILRSEELAGAVRTFVENRVDDLLSRRLGSIVNEEAFAQFAVFIEERFHSIVTEPGFADKVRAFLGARLEELAASRATLAEIITPSTVAVIRTRIDEQLPPIVQQLAEIATSERTRTRIGALIKREVDDYYAQLSFFKKIFVSRERIHGEVDDLVNSTLPRRVAEYLHGADFEEEVKNFLNSSIENVLARPINELLGKIAPDKLESIKDQITERILALVGSPELLRTISAYATDAFDRLKPHTLRALLQNFRPESAARVKNLLTKALLDVLAREETAQTISSILSDQVDRLLIKPIGRPADHLPNDSILRASAALTDRITLATRERLPTALAEFDIGGIVRRKVADYPVEKLESLVLSVAQQHLRTIELFGLVMGFFIGVAQPFLLKLINYFWA